VHPAIAPLAAILRLNTELLLNCLVTLDDRAARSRAAPSGNTVAVIVAHLIDSRHRLAAMLGAPTGNPISPGASDGGPMVTLVQLIAAWEAVSAHLAVCIERLDTPALASRVDRAYPGSDGTLLGNLAFLVQHESYHLGQLGLLRRQLGYPAMGYSLKPREPGRRGA
jgi:uncharacterized damage-inducible protein DinB